MYGMEMPEKVRMEMAKEVSEIPREKIKRLQEMGFIDKDIRPSDIYFELSDKERVWLYNRIVLMNMLKKSLSREWKGWHKSHVIKRRKIVRSNNGQSDKVVWETLPEEEHHVTDSNGKRVNRLRRRLKAGESWFEVSYDGTITDKMSKRSPPPVDIEDGWQPIYEDVLDTVDRAIQVVQDKQLQKATSVGGRTTDDMIRQMQSMSMLRRDNNAREER